MALGVDGDSAWVPESSEELAPLTSTGCPVLGQHGFGADLLQGDVLQGDVLQGRCVSGMGVSWTGADLPGPGSARGRLDWMYRSIETSGGRG